MEELFAVVNFAERECFDSENGYICVAVASSAYSVLGCS